MVCIYCGNSTRIYNSRHIKRVNGTWRRHSCNVCGSTFSSIEAPDLSSSWIVAKSKTNSLEPFHRNKLYISLYEALRHRNNPMNDAEEICNTIIEASRDKIRDGLLLLDDLQDIICTTLSNFDESGLVYYKAYYMK